MDLRARTFTGRPCRVRVGLFTDVARAWHGLAPITASRTQMDVGVGLRLRMAGDARALRIDVAHGLRDGRRAMTPTPLTLAGGTTRSDLAHPRTVFGTEGAHWRRRPWRWRHAPSGSRASVDCEPRNAHFIRTWKGLGVRRCSGGSPQTMFSSRHCSLARSRATASWSSNSRIASSSPACAADSM